MDLMDELIDCQSKGYEVSTEFLDVVLKAN